MKVHGFHSSGRVDRSMDLLSRSIDRLRAIEGMSLGSGTEASGRKDAMLAHNKGWDWAHISKKEAETRAARECWAMWKNKVWDQTGEPITKILSPMTFTRAEAYGGHEAPPFRLLVVPLIHKGSKTLVDFCVAHLSLDNTQHRADIWVDQTEGLVEIIKERKASHPRRKFIINADFNKNWRQANERHMLMKHVARPLHANVSWDGHVPRHGGTHGPLGLIDATVTDLPVAGCRLLADDRSSDHRPYGFALRMPAKR